jgi:hypothetical protein
MLIIKNKANYNAQERKIKQEFLNLKKRRERKKCCSWLDGEIWCFLGRRLGYAETPSSKYRIGNLNGKKVHQDDIQVKTARKKKRKGNLETQEYTSSNAE